MDIGIPMSDEPKTPITPIVTKPDVTEHPISEAEAKKYAGTGDFSAPTSPLDQLVAPDSTVVPQASAVKPSVVDSTIPVATQNSASASPVIATTQPEKLEDKAKDMLKELDKAVPPKPKKNSGAITKMALAAVLVVLMGAGGVVGMNLMNQTTENRSQAGGEAAGCNGEYECEDSCGSNCQRKCWLKSDPHKNICGTEMCNYTNNAGTTYIGARCNCASGAQTFCATDFISCDKSCGGGTVEEFCRCDRYDDACGTNCTFPQSAKDAVERAAAGSCKAFIAMCGSDGKWHVEEYNSSNVCWGKKDQCNNPYAEDTCEPQTGFSCTSLNKDNTAPKIGQTVTFTCTGSASNTTINHYEFQYYVDNTGPVTLPANGATTTLKIAKKGAYKVQCRVCESADASKCTAWGVAQ